MLPGGDAGRGAATWYWARQLARQPRRGIKNSSVNTGDPEKAKSKASKNASAPREGQEMSDDDMLLRVIEAWASLTAARKKMILKLTEMHGAD